LKFLILMLQQESTKGLRISEVLKTPEDIFWAVVVLTIVCGIILVGFFILLDKNFTEIIKVEALIINKIIIPEIRYQTMLLPSYTNDIMLDPTYPIVHIIPATYYLVVRVGVDYFRPKKITDRIEEVEVTSEFLDAVDFDEICHLTLKRSKLDGTSKVIDVE